MGPKTTQKNIPKKDTSTLGYHTEDPCLGGPDPEIQAFDEVPSSAKASSPNGGSRSRSKENDYGVMDFDEAEAAERIKERRASNVIAGEDDLNVMVAMSNRNREMLLQGRSNEERVKELKVLKEKMEMGKR